MKPTKTFRCERCGGRFPDTATETELRDEHNAHFPELRDAEIPREDLRELCTRCFREFMTWFRTLTDDEKRALREGAMSDMKRLADAIATDDSKRLHALAMRRFHNHWISHEDGHEQFRRGGLNICRNCAQPLKRDKDKLCAECAFLAGQ